MDLDAKLVFADSVDLTGMTVGDDDGVLMTDIDLASALHDLAGGRRTPWFRVSIEVDIEGTTSTVDFQLQDSPDDITYTDVAGYASGLVAEATLVAGYKVLDMPLGDDLARYLRFNVEVAVNTLTAGKVNAFLYFRD